MDDESIGLQHEVTPHEPSVCELCGRPFARNELRAVSVARGIGEPVETMRICPACARADEEDEVPYDAEIGAGLREADG